MNLKNRRSIYVLIIAVVLAIVAIQLVKRDERALIYKTAKVDRGEISSYVNASGTVNPTATVEIGSQLSGIVKVVYADFNASVAKGDPLAEIDPGSFVAKVEQAKADLRKAEADAELTKTITDANEELYASRLISKREYEDSRVKYASALAAVEQATVELEVARSNLSSTIIRSPIEGTVTSRNINPGEAIAPGSNSHPLFVVAEELSTMNVIAHVSEADIGKLKPGQSATFTVNAYPDEVFSGIVRQVRNQPLSANNVVTYDVVIQVENAQLKLKPGMTAEVRIMVAQKENALRLPRAALRFIPPPGAQIQGDPQEVDSASVVWVPSSGEGIKPVPVEVGINDEYFTEIVDGHLKEGEEIIVDAVRSSEQDADTLDSILPKPKRF